MTATSVRTILTICALGDDLSQKQVFFFQADPWKNRALMSHNAEYASRRCWDYGGRAVTMQVTLFIELENHFLQKFNRLSLVS